MNFLTQKQELAAQLGLDQTDSDDNTLLGRWLNTSQRIIIGAFDWPFMRATNPLIIQTVADEDTGTVSTTSDNASATLSASITPTVLNRYIQTSDSDDWFRISAHTAGTTGLTLNPVAINTNTEATFIIRKFFYSLSSSVDRVLSIKQAITPFKLEELTKEQFNNIQPDPTSTGTPRLYMQAGLDSSGVPQICLWPTPDAEINLWIEFITTGTDLSADSDVSVIPQKWHTSVMIEGAKWQGFDFLDDTRIDGSKRMFGNMLDDMKKNYATSKTQHRRLRSIDNTNLLDPLLVPFPGSFPNV